MNGTATIPGDYETGKIKAIADPYYYAQDEEMRHHNRISDLLELDSHDQEAEAQSGVSHQSGVSQLAKMVQGMEKKVKNTQAEKQQAEKDIKRILGRYEKDYNSITLAAIMFVFKFGSPADIAKLQSDASGWNGNVSQPNVNSWLVWAEKHVKPYNWNA